MQSFSLTAVFLGLTLAHCGSRDEGSDVHRQPKEPLEVRYCHFIEQHFCEGAELHPVQACRDAGVGGRIDAGVNCDAEPVSCIFDIFFEEFTDCTYSILAVQLDAKRAGCEQDFNELLECTMADGYVVDEATGAVSLTQTCEQRERELCVLF